jgi:LacI family transcriptional regulator
MTIKDIARLAKVSITTVSLILNGKDQNIREETRQRVLKVVNEHNYRPNSVARSMITKKSKILGLIIPDVTNQYFAEMARAAESTAKELGYSIILCNTDENPDTEAQYVQLLREKQADGLILVSTALSDYKELEQIRREKYPVVILDRRTYDENDSVVCFDNIAAGRMAVEYLIQNGHKHIGCITGPQNNPSSIDRYTGFCQAMEAAGLSYTKEQVIEGDYQVKSGEDGIEKILGRSKITAVFCLNDMMAYGAYKGCHKHNLQIPEDISINSIDDDILSSVIIPALTTIKQPGVEMCTTAVKMLIKEIEDKEDYDKFINFNPILIERESVMKRT